MDEWISDCGRIRLICGDSLDVVPTLPNVDATITDPPYGVEGGKGAISKARAKSNYLSTDDTPEMVKTVVIPVIQACIAKSKRVALTPGTRCCFMYPPPDEMGSFYYPAACGMSRWGYNCFQPILFYGKCPHGGTLGHSNSRRSTEPADKSLSHPCPKPIGDWTWLTELASVPGETVLDPFAGSGTTGVVCAMTERQFIGIEKERHYFNLAKERIEKVLIRLSGDFHKNPSDFPLFSGL